jgi:hypothetical protein
MNKNTLGTLASQLSIPSEDEILRDELQAYADQNNKQRKVTQHGVMGDAVAIVDQTWIWDSYIPAAYTLVTGTAGSQKSWLLCELAATVSAGRNWPDGTACTQHGVIVISGEDSQSTLAGRMRNCGADLSRVLFLDTVKINDAGTIEASSELPFSLPRDFKVLQEAIIQINASIVLIDPVSAIFENSTSNQFVRNKILSPITRMCEALDVAVVCINHINKGQVANKNVGSRIQGASALHEAARVSYLIAPDESEQSIATAKQVKNNLAPLQHPLRYTVIKTLNRGHHVQWLSEDNNDIVLLPRGNDATETQKAIASEIFHAERALSSTEIIQRLTPRHKTSTVKMAISRMCEIDRLVKESRGQYDLPPQYRKNRTIITQIESQTAPQALPSPRTSSLDTWLAP